MSRPLAEIIAGYKRNASLAEASTIPADWYTDPRVLDLERRTVFSRVWQVAGRVDQLQRQGQYITCETAAGEPIVIVRGSDDVLRGFFNVCRHHAAAVATEAEGSATYLRCPYHGWTYSLEGELKGTPDFAGVCHFDRAANGLIPIDIDVWEQWVFVRVERRGSSLAEFLGSDLVSRFPAGEVTSLKWMARRRYNVECNWKVFIDNYLDGGYHVPHLHKGLDSVLDYSEYTIENGQRFCLQSSPMVADGADARTAAVRTGKRALYFWLYPNFMINCYAGTMDTNLVIPRGPDRTEVVFDFFFADVSQGAGARNLESIATSEQIQQEDVAICASVQQGLRSRAYSAGRLSVRREAGEHLFHRLLHDDLITGLDDSRDRR
jgi:phenylpropionate dioxygenase-like ring-hydroxylating dioxygenase large terminal subunit